MSEDIARLERHLADLAVTVDRVDRRDGDQQAVNKAVARQVAGLAAELVRVTQRLATIKPPPEDQAPPVEWMTISDPGLAAEALLDLRDWVDQVWVQYAPLTDCWPWHPPVVAELLACRGYWLAAFAPEAPRQAAAEWHARLRPAAAAQVGYRMTMCDRTMGHAGPAEVRYLADLTEVYAYARWWATSRACPEVPPGLNLRVSVSDGAQ